ncbi:cytochrome P450 4C1-like [Brevipalpus obovatus]|uniref:cytochrome P450 4C1-like n=1 Tax=Brevipalpus obovatus TaxID=246614 RepID=UPI003D9F299A
MTEKQTLLYILCYNYIPVIFTLLVLFILYKHVIYISAYWNFPRLKQMRLLSLIKLFSVKSNDIRGQLSFIGQMPDRGEGWIVLGLPIYPVIITYEPTINKKILNSKLPGRGLLTRLTFEGIDGLIVSSSKKWHQRRTLIAPSYSQKVMETFIPIIVEHSIQLVNDLDTMVGQWVDFHSIIFDVEMGIFLDTSMGLRHSQLSALRPTIAELMKTWLKNQFHRVRNILLWNETVKVIYFYITGRRNTRKLLEQICLKIIDQRVEDHKNGLNSIICDNVLKSGEEIQLQNGTKSSEKTKVFLDHLIEAHLENQEDPKIDRKGLFEEVINFTAGGTETVASGVRWVLHSLANHPKIQEELYQELESMNLNDPNLSPMYLDSFQLLDQCCKETLRLRPGIPWIPRVLGEDVWLGKHLVPKGTQVYVSTYYTHRDSTIYPSPKKFDPSRFSPENIEKIPPGGYIPFGAGPRRCIGYKTGLVIMKILLCYIIKNFTVTTLDPMNVKIEFTGVVEPKVPIKFKFERRQISEE